MFDPGSPYNDLPRLPPEPEVETRAVLKKCVAARTALAELRLAGQLAPDQGTALADVLIHTIPNLEARASSEIENIVTTNDALFREASLGDHAASYTTKEAARYRTALYQGEEALRARPLSTKIAVEVCRTITGIDLDIRAIPVNLKNQQTGEIIYTPPADPNRLRELLANWERFIHESPELDTLVRMAVQHYQFEAIHPFSDGNGRTGRVLNILGLIQDGLLDRPTLYLSRHILGTRGDYYRLLGRVTSHGEWEPWILYILTAVEETSRWTTAKIRSIHALMSETVVYVRTGAPRLPPIVVEKIFKQPYIRIGNLIDDGIAKRETASTYLKQLMSLGVLEEEKVGRDKIFLHRKYLDVLFSDGHAFELYPRPAQENASKRSARARGPDQP